MKRIETIKEISSQQPQKQVWKYLRTFLDESTTTNRIKKFHKIPIDKKDNNIKKQAEQIGYCISQAEEYYKSAKYATVTTKPLLLYYGSISLSTALILFVNEGNVSFDYLRKTGKKWGHGLDAKFNNFPKNLKGIALDDILKNICATIRKDDNNIAKGHFSKFYNSLIPSAVIIPVSQKTNKTLLNKKVPQNSIDIKALDKIDNDLLNTLTLTLNLPDMYDYYLDIGIKPNLCKARPQIKSILHYEKDKVIKVSDKHDVLIDGINIKEKKILLNYLLSKKSAMKTILDIPDHLILSSTYKYGPQELFDSYYPDLLDSINGDIFIIVNPEKALEEKATLYILLYCFGILCRYSPDIWMRLINGSVAFKEFIDSLLQVIERKFPNLILDQLMGGKHYIHL
ncbi:MAG: hypothetical protein ISS81_07635 [Candidatus Marinimicrobia bacterium]|nr:hypothetical protein [Candidatus Neomarinimicrobiota bacterium]